jgi:hypothetical protein
MLKKSLLERLSYPTIACDAEKKVVAEHLSGNYIKTKITDDIIELNMPRCLKHLCHSSRNCHLVMVIISNRY